METFSNAELERLLADVESDLTERKQSFKGDSPKKARQAICAFANDLPDRQQPGDLFIGAQDNGTPSSEPITDELWMALLAVMPMRCRMLKRILKDWRKKLIWKW